METGLQIISKERRRHFSQEGWTVEHDAEHYPEELACAAGCYALAGETRGTFRYKQILELWPWDKKWWKPTPDDRVRELAKAGALIAAEIDKINGVDGSKELQPQEQVTVREIKEILSTYEKEWDNKKKKFKLLNHFQKDKVDGAAQAIHSLVYGEKGEQWISVNDRLPKINPGNLALSKNVLVYGFSGYYEAYYNHRKKQWESYEWNECIKVTHWMPLPQPPKAEE